MRKLQAPSGEESQISPLAIEFSRRFTKGLSDNAEIVINTTEVPAEITQKILRYYRNKGRSIIQGGEHLYIGKENPLRGS